MRIEDQRRSDNFEDRGTGRSGGSGGVPIQALFAVVRVLGFKGTLIAGALVGSGVTENPSERSSIARAIFVEIPGASDSVRLP